MRGAAVALGLLLLLGSTEAVLRLREAEPPAAVPRPETTRDRRPFHLADAAMAYEATLLWRPLPQAPFNEDGYSGPRLRQPRDPDAYRILVLGDENASALGAEAHWPGLLQDLLRQNRTRQVVEVLDAAVPGYSLAQGAARFREALRDEPDLAFLAFGANDALPVHTADSAYASRLAWRRRLLWLRLALYLAGERGDAQAATVPRVPLDEYGALLARVLDEAARRRVTPVLVTPPLAPAAGAERRRALDGYRAALREAAASRSLALLDLDELLRDEPGAFAGPALLARSGQWRAAEAAFALLRRLGVVETDERLPTAPLLRPGLASDRRLELGAGWWGRERWDHGGSGRWTQAEASVRLRRAEGEGGLLVDASCLARRGTTRVAVEAQGRTLLAFDCPNGRWQRLLDVRALSGELLELFLVASPHVPHDEDGRDQDRRTLGVFVHELRLVPWPAPPVELEREAPAAAALGVPGDLASLEYGFWPREQWATGSGRWTRGEAALRLRRTGAEKALVVDASFDNPARLTTGWIEVNGRNLYDFRAENGRQRFDLALEGVKEPDLLVRFVVDRPFTPPRDRRVLGMFVHGARLAKSPVL